MITNSISYELCFSTAFVREIQKKLDCGLRKWSDVKYNTAQHAWDIAWAESVWLEVVEQR